MSNPYQLFVLSPNGIAVEEAVITVHQVLEAAGGCIDDDSILLLNDTDSEEPEPEDIVNPQEALQKIICWPTHGSIVYAMPEGMTTVSYMGTHDSKKINCVEISVLQKAFENGGEESTQRYLKIAYELHEAFHAKRTIMDWGLKYRGFRWEEEIERLKQGILTGEYEIADITG